MMRGPALIAIVLGCIFLPSSVWAQEKKAPSICWPQFRGPEGLGIAPDNKALPVQFGPDKNVLWKTPLPKGHSSPCLWGEVIFLTAQDQDKKHLETICLDRKTGHLLWKQSIKPKKIEHTHQIGSPATPTPATDGERVYVYFGSYGLLCYDFQGKLVWERPLPMPQTRFGTGASPILAGDLLVMSCDFLPTPYLLAVNPKTGDTVWKKEWIPVFMEGYATPFHWKHDGKEEIVLHTSTRIRGFDLKEGEERWWVGIKSTAGSTPVAGGGKLFASTWIHGGEAEDSVPVPPFPEFLKMHDKNKDGKIDKDEFPPEIPILKRKEVTNVGGAVVKLVWYFNQIDKNKDGKIEQSEWGVIPTLGYSPTDHGLLAIKPGGKDDATKTHVAWSQKKSIPEISSPLYYQGLVYLVREGGIVTCLDAKTGKQYYKERVGAEGAYFSSPVAGDGKIYACSYDGVVSVIAAGKEFRLLSRNDLGERIMATPALVDGHVYIRTEKHLYAFK